MRIKQALYWIDQLPGGMKMKVYHFHAAVIQALPPEYCIPLGELLLLPSKQITNV